MKTGAIDKEKIPKQILNALNYYTVDYPKDLSKKLKDILDDVLVHHTSRKSAEYVLKKHFQQNNDSMARVHNEEPDWTIFAESDTEHEKAQCQKNPEHLEFIPAEKFEVKNIPLRFGIKIDVKTISTQRCKQWPRTNVAYPYSGFSMGSNQARNGTGFVHLAMFDKEFEECNKSSNGKVCGTVDIISATHVIYDQTEADHTTVTFSVDGVDKELNSFKVVNADVEKNLCVIRSQVYDRDLLYTLHSLLENFESLRKHVYADHSGSYRITPTWWTETSHYGTSY
ncbi:hypothetical protein Btru_042489 [Bulinus truncatus]|nr:hypothetical protein Btru_042489 [Bulinus truncatus]